MEKTQKLKTNTEFGFISCLYVSRLAYYIIQAYFHILNDDKFNFRISENINGKYPIIGSLDKLFNIYFCVYMRYFQA